MNIHPLRDSSFELFVMTVDVHFGVPSRNCAGIGICKVDKNPNNVLPILPFKRAHANVFLDEVNGTICFAFQKCNLHSLTDKLMFSKDYFQVNETITLPGWLTEAFGMPEVTIEKGIYPLETFENSYIVSFPLENTSGDSMLDKFSQNKKLKNDSPMEGGIS